MVSAIISRLVILVFGLLYPAYNSYKAVKTKNVKEYVKWMMYWIVFAFFTCVETFADLFLSWVPFYYELKILFVLWLLSPATKGSSYLYRKFLHPQLAKREKEIDNYISKASDEGYTALLSLGSKGINYATNVVLTTAIKGQTKIVDHLKKSYSLGDISQSQDNTPVYREEVDEDETDNRIIEESYREEMGQEAGQSALSDEIRPRRKGSQRSADLYSVDEGDEVDNSMNKSQPRPKRTYSHKEPLMQSGSAPSTPTGIHHAQMYRHSSAEDSPTPWRRRARRKPITMEPCPEPHDQKLPPVDPQ